MSREQAERVAQKWAEFFPTTSSEPAEEPDQMPELNKGNIIPNAGNQPGQLTADQLAALEAQSHGGDTASAKFAHLAKLLQQNQ